LSSSFMDRQIWTILLFELWTLFHPKQKLMGHFWIKILFSMTLLH
jgi:hypothetical protein